MGWDIEKKAYILELYAERFAYASNSINMASAFNTAIMRENDFITITAENTIQQWSVVDFKQLKSVDLPPNDFSYDGGNYPQFFRELKREGLLLLASKKTIAYLDAESLEIKEIDFLKDVINAQYYMHIDDKYIFYSKKSISKKRVKHFYRLELHSKERSEFSAEAFKRDEEKYISYKSVVSGIRPLPVVSRNNISVVIREGFLEVYNRATQKRVAVLHVFTDETWEFIVSDSNLMQSKHSR